MTSIVLLHLTAIMAQSLRPVGVVCGSGLVEVDSVSMAYSTSTQQLLHHYSTTTQPLLNCNSITTPPLLHLFATATQPLLHLLHYRYSTSTQLLLHSTSPQT